MRSYFDFDVFINTDCRDKFDPELLGDFRFVELIDRDPEDIDAEESANRDGSPVEQMLGKFIEKYVTNLDEPIVLTHVTSPFLGLNSVLEAIKFLDKGYKSVHSVKRIQDFAFFAPSDKGGNWRPLNFDDSKIERTQDLQPVFLSLGAFFITTKRTWMESHRRITFPAYFFELSSLEAIEIDSQSDWSLAEAVASNEIN